MTIKEAVRRSIYEFLREDIKDSEKDVKAVNQHIKQTRKKIDREIHDKDGDCSDEPDRGPEFGEDDPYTKFKKRMKKGKEKREKDKK